LQEEREKSIFNREKMEDFVLGTETKERMRLYYEDLKNYPKELIADFKSYDYTREEAMEKWLEKYNMVA
jgi:hypothetical protein